MKGKKVVSRKTFSVIKFACDAFSFFIMIVVGNIYNLHNINSLNFWIFMVIALTIYAAGNALIRKFFIVNK